MWPFSKKSKTDTNDNPTLLGAVSSGNQQLVLSLLQQGANPNEIDNKNQTPLHIAATKGMSECIEYLVQNGARIDEQMPDGSTPLIMAVKSGSESAVTTLLRLGANRSLKCKVPTSMGDIAMDAVGVANLFIVKYGRIDHKNILSKLNG